MRVSSCLIVLLTVGCHGSLEESPPTGFLSGQTASGTPRSIGGVADSTAMNALGNNQGAVPGARGGGIAGASAPSGAGGGTAGQGGSPSGGPTGFPPGTTGWTDLPDPPAGARTVFVSAAGNDSNDGLAADRPKRTVEAGYAQIRDGQGDRLLLRRGDSFDITTRPLLWTRSGASESAPAVYGAYGTGPRPIVRAGDGQALQFTPGYQSPNVLRHVAAIGVHFVANARDPGSPSFNGGKNGGAAITIGASQTSGEYLGDDVLVEDCLIEWFATGVVSEGGSDRPKGNRNIRIRRNQIVNSYCVGQNCSNAIYSDNTDGLLIEENLIDKLQQGPVSGSEPSVFNHSVYAQANDSNVVIRGNIFARVPDGTMQRSGGAYEGNLVVRAGIGVLQGYVYSGITPVVGGVTTTVIGNAFVELNDISPSLPRGVAIILGNIKSGVVTDNIIAHEITAMHTTSHGIDMHGDTTAGNSGVRDLRIENNVIYDVQNMLHFNSGTYAGVSVKANTFHAMADSPVNAHDDALGSGVFSYTSNTWFSVGNGSNWFRVANANLSLNQWLQQPGIAGDHTPAVASFVDPTRSVGSYHASLGRTGTLEAFLDIARQQSHDSYSPDYTAAAVIDYLRQGYTAQ